MRLISLKILLAWLIGVLVVVATTASAMAAQLNTSQPPGGEASSAYAIVKATVTYGDALAGGQGALAGNRVLTVQLLDITRADTPAVVLGEQTIQTTGGRVSLPLEFRYDPSAIAPNGVYGVVASITAGGRLVLQSAMTPVTLAQDHPTMVAVRLENVSSGRSLGLPIGIERLAQFGQ